MAKLQFQCRHYISLVGCGVTLLFLAFVTQSCATLSEVNSRGDIAPSK
jgi:hypothetical protein